MPPGSDGDAVSGQAAAPPARAYLRDPDAIYAASFAAIRREIALEAWPPTLRSTVLRLVHACALPEIAGDLRHRGDPASAAIQALQNGAPILVDASMVAAGIRRASLPAANAIVLTLDDPEVAPHAAALGTTRAAAAVDLWRDRMEGAVIAIGNAPTALFRLLDLLDAGAPRPAALFAFPIGFIGAAEAKQSLIEADIGVPFLTLRGRFGGSALAAAAINALLIPT